jgi:hypothetical protein
VFPLREDHDVRDRRLGDLTAAVPEDDVVARLTLLQLQVVARAGSGFMEYEGITIVDGVRRKFHGDRLGTQPTERTRFDVSRSTSLDDQPDSPASHRV